MIRLLEPGPTANGQCIEAQLLRQVPVRQIHTTALLQGSLLPLLKFESPLANTIGSRPDTRRIVTLRPTQQRIEGNRYHFDTQARPQSDRIETRRHPSHEPDMGTLQVHQRRQGSDGHCQALVELALPGMAVEPLDGAIVMRHPRA